MTDIKIANRLHAPPGHCAVKAMATNSHKRRKWAYIRHMRQEFFRLLLERLWGKPFFQQSVVTTADLNEGLTVVLPGIEAAGPFAQGMVRGLAGAVPGAVRIFYWGIPFPEGYVPNLIWLNRNRAKAAELAQLIVTYQDQYPGRPVNIVANSGGAGPAIFAVEMLPPDRAIDGLVFLGGAISSCYDLRPALRRLRNGIFNFYSRRDWIVLGIGTTLFGTSDRKPHLSCGFVGFKRPEQLADPEYLYARLYQVKWQPSLIDDCGHWGTHGFSASEEFVRRHVAPWIVNKQPAGTAECEQSSPDNAAVP